MEKIEKQAELDYTWALIEAALDYYHVGRRGLESGSEAAPSLFEHLRPKARQLYDQGALTKLKFYWKCIVEVPRETGDFAFSNYVSQKTGAKLDIFKAFDKRIDRIMQRGKISSEEQYREISEAVDRLSQELNPDYGRIDDLNRLLNSFNLGRNSGK